MVTVYEQTIFPLILAWALQQCSANALPVIKRLRFFCINLYGKLSTKYVKYYAFVTFLLSCLGYTFFLATPPRASPWTHFNHLWLKWRVVTQECAFWGFGWPPTILTGSPLKTKKGAWLGIFQPTWHNYKIVKSTARNIGSIPNVDRVIEPHRWLRGWSRITIRIQDGGRSKMLETL